MTVLIKRADEGKLDRRPVVWAPRLGASEPLTPGLTTEQATIAALEQELADCRARLDESAERIEAARRDGEASGRLAAETAFEDDRTEALAKLEHGFRAAQESLSSKLDSIETVSLAIAEAVVTKLLGSPEAYKGLYFAAIDQAFRRLRSETVLALEVSRQDFPDTSEVAVLAARSGLSENAVLVRDHLEPGSCIARLKIGSLEIGIGQQWQRLRELIGSMGRVE